MRLNAPSLVVPQETIVEASARQLGIQPDHIIQERIDLLDRLIGQQREELNQLRSLIALPAQDIVFATPQVLRTSSFKGSVTATTVTSTAGVTITNSNIPALSIGIPYLIVAKSGMTLNAPAGQSCIACVRIEATGTTVDGTRTTTVGGERWGEAVDFKVLMGTGSSINIAGRSRVTGGSGSVNDAFSWGIAIPLGAMVGM